MGTFQHSEVLPLRSHGKMGWLEYARPFEPLFRNPDLLTIAANFWPRRLDTVRFPVARWQIQTEPGVQVVVMSQRPAAAPKAEVLMIHGLEGSSEAGYLRSLAQAAVQAGYGAHRMNIRGCGGTEHLSRTLYHSGLTTDARAILEHLRRGTGRPLFLVGFSLGGNVALKLAGELGGAARSLLAGVCAVSTPIDLLVCARRLGAPRNFLYQRRFVERMKQRLRERHRLRPGLFPIAGLDRVRTIYQFDDAITAPHFGFDDAAHYYTTQSANRYLDRIAVATLMVQAKDDPLIPYQVFRHPAIAANPSITSITTERGGHIGFLARLGSPRLGSPQLGLPHFGLPHFGLPQNGSRFWVDPLITGWMDGLLRRDYATIEPAAGP